LPIRPRAGHADADADFAYAHFSEIQHPELSVSELHAQCCLCTMVSGGNQSARKRQIANLFLSLEIACQTWYYCVLPNLGLSSFFVSETRGIELTTLWNRVQNSVKIGKELLM